MYLTIRIYRDEAQDAVAEIKKRQDSLLQALREVPGLVHWYGVDLGSGGLASVTVCQHQAGADESVRVAAAWVRENIARWAPNPPTVITGEVIVDAGT
jgi:hypothetical protein